MNPSLKQLIFILTFIYLGHSLAASVPGLYLGITSNMQTNSSPGPHQEYHRHRSLEGITSLTLGEQPYQASNRPPWASTTLKQEEEKC